MQQKECVSASGGWEQGLRAEAGRGEFQLLSSPGPTCEPRMKYCRNKNNSCFSVTRSCLTLRDPTDHSTPGSPSFTISQSLLSLMSTESVVASKHLILCLLLCPQFFPASGSFPRSWLFAPGGQSIGASASVLIVNIQGWFPLGLTGLISLQSKGLSRVFANTIVQKHQFFSAQPSLWSNSNIHTWLIEKP